MLGRVIDMHLGIAGAGIMGRIMALQLLRQGWRVSLFDRDAPTGGSAAAYTAAGMLTPWSELESAELLIYRLGRRSLQLWPGILAELNADADFHDSGSLILAHPGDRPDYQHFANLLASKLPASDTWRRLDKPQLQALAPELAGRFQQALYLPGEAWLCPEAVMRALADYLHARQLTWHANTDVTQLGPGYLVGGGARHAFDWVLDCRGLGARRDIPRLRGVRGELMLLWAPDVKLRHLVRLMHPRYRLYVVPRRDDNYVIGATQIESDDSGPITLRSSLELLSAAYSLHPGFAEARVLESRTNCRPALADNLPQVIIEEQLIRINGLFRHGFLLAPAIAEAVARWLQQPQPIPCNNLLAQVA